MRRSGSILAGVTWALTAAAASLSTNGTLLKTLPLRFEANQGRDQHRQVQFIARGPNFRLALAPRESWLEWNANGKAGRVRTQILHANPATKMSLENRLPGVANYFLGSGPDWHTAVAGYGSVRYREIYPGVDLIFHGEERRLEYDFVVGPHADPSQIRLEMTGQRSLRVDKDGDLAIATDAGEIRWKAPECYQEIGGKKAGVEGRFVVDGKNVVRFEIGNYDREHALVIDPTLKYSTYIGGPNNEAARGIAVDGSGNVYVVGVSSSPTLPTTGSAYQPNFGGQTAIGGNFTGDGFVAKFDSNQKLVYFTYLGGSRDDGLSAIAVDTAGNAYVTGGSNSPDFPTVNAYQGTYASGKNGLQFADDIVVAKLDPTGSKLLFSTYLGGNDNDIGLGIVLDKAGNVYICGASASTNFPTMNPPAQGARFSGAAGEPIRHPERDIVPEWEPGDAIIAELDPTGSKLLFSMYLGGSQDDVAFSIALDSANNVYVGGCTISSGGSFPTTQGAYQTTFGGNDFNNFFFHMGDGFVTKINPSASTIVYSTLFGGEGDDCVSGIALDSTNAVYLAGSTSSQSFPSNVPRGGAQQSYSGYTTLPFNVFQNFGDGFVAKLDPTGSKILYFTYIGGPNNDAATAIALDSQNNAYVLGFTDSPSGFPITANAIQPKWAGDGGLSQFLFFGDGFLTVVNPTGTQFLYSSYFGGINDERPLGMAVDPSGNVYVAGNTISQFNFPTTPNALQKSYNGAKGHANGTPNGDAFLAIFSGLLNANGPTITKVANAEGGESPTISANTWVEIKGTNFSLIQRTWQGSDFVNNQLPTALEGVSVTMNGIACYVYFISSGQINVLTPLNLSNGPVNVVVTTPNGQSNTFVSQAASISLAFFVFDGTHIIGQHASNLLQDVGPVNLFPGLTFPAQSGETVVLYMNGFGTVTSTLTPGSIFQSGSLPLPLPTMTVNNQPAQVSFAGLISPGLYQFNVTLPLNLPNGDLPIQAQYQGQTTPAGAVIAIQN